MGIETGQMRARMRRERQTWIDVAGEKANLWRKINKQSLLILTFCQDPNGPVTLRTSKFITNRLLNRKQFVLTVLHPTRANLSRNELSEKLAALYKTDKERVAVFGLKTKFGGGVSQGFGLVYDDEESQKKFEPKHRLVRVSKDGVMIQRLV